MFLKTQNLEKIDLISIDIEGFEELAWGSFDYTKYNPSIIITEHTEMGKFDDTFTKKILENPNYYLAHTTPLNFIILRKDVKRKNQ